MTGSTARNDLKSRNIVPSFKVLIPLLVMDFQIFFTEETFILLRLTRQPFWWLKFPEMWLIPSWMDIVSSKFFQKLRNVSYSCKALIPFDLGFTVCPLWDTSYFFFYKFWNFKYLTLSITKIKTLEDTSFGCYFVGKNKKSLTVIGWGIKSFLFSNLNFGVCLDNRNRQKEHANNKNVNIRKIVSRLVLIKETISFKWQINLELLYEIETVEK